MNPGPLASGRCGERGSGLLSSLFGVTMLLVLLALASQVALGLLRRTTTEGVAYDAARRVATAPEGMSRAEAEERARHHARQVLGEAADGVELRFLPATADRVVLQVRAEGVSLLPSTLGDGVRFGGVDRRIVLVRETP
jgi:guanyl-specific ribonuclease Sa